MEKHNRSRDIPGGLINFARTCLLATMEMKHIANHDEQFDAKTFTAVYRTTLELLEAADYQEPTGEGNPLYTGETLSEANFNNAGHTGHGNDLYEDTEINPDSLQGYYQWTQQ